MAAGSSNKLPDPGKCGSMVPLASRQIYGGTRTNIGSYPWAVNLIYHKGESNDNLFKCGGSLISERYVLTAAHCLTIINSDLRLNRIRLGEWDLLKEQDCNAELICADPPLDVGIEKYGSRNKLHVSLKGVSNDVCGKVYVSKIFPSHLCAGAEKGKDACQKDSGGGLVAAIDGVYYEYGIVSFGSGCGLQGVPGVYARVTTVLDWILKQLD
ncbi:serine protease easter-like [Sabethes cyaneus]|uniref:serine protease easter-like n=1 Tax=Sabethes cyaneus TaxID=53552 RepID=UPI00237E3E27|nr:serine protease easter-like [Sabethes cyaneus]